MASEEGRQEGTLETSREFVIEILETRFGEVPSSIVEFINGIDKPSVLKKIFRRSIAHSTPAKPIAIESVEEFQHVLEQLTSGEISD